MARHVSGGREANAAGRTAEHVIGEFLRSRGFQFDAQVVVGKNIYGGDLTTDFVVYNARGFPNNLAIESKWQDTSGSVDEKFPFLVENIKHRYPMPVLVVVAGSGCRPGALAWLKSRVDGQRLVRVLNLEEMMTWFRREAPPISPDLLLL